MSCWSEPQRGGEVIVAVCGLLDLFIYIILIIIIIIIIIIIYRYLYTIISNITAKGYVPLG